MRFVVVKFRRGGWAPTEIEAIVDGNEVVAIRAIDVSGGEYYPYSWRLSDWEREFLKEEVRAAIDKENDEKTGQVL